MQIPSIFYGNYRSVRRSVRALAEAFIEGRAVDALVKDTLDPATVSGWIVLDEPRRQLQGEENFFVGTLAEALLEIGSKRGHNSAPWWRFHDWSFREAGTLLTSVGQEATAQIYMHRELQSSLVEAAIRHWSDLTSVGARYVARVTAVPSGLWDFPNAITGAITTLSQSRWTLQPLPPGGLVELVETLGLPVQTPDH